MDKTYPCPKCKGTGEIPNPIFVGQQMRALRESKAVSLHTMAKKLGITALYLCDMELGRRNFSPEYVQRIRSILE